MRGIVEIRFDIVISDSFDKELCRVPDITYEPEEPLWTTYSGLSIGSLAWETYSIEYSRLYTNGIEQFERARRYSTSNNVQAAAQVTGVVFDDGEVLLAK
jgi:hypothetical protein